MNASLTDGAAVPAVLHELRTWTGPSTPVYA